MENGTGRKMTAIKTKKANLIIYITLAVLLSAMVLLAFLNRGDAALKRALEENREFHLRVNGEYAATVSLQTLIDMDPQDFSTTFTTSITASRNVDLRGVELRFLLEAAEIDISGASHFVVSGLDNFYVVVSSADVNRGEYIYIWYMMDGEMLEPMSKGGMGPFLLVYRGDIFAYRWCKYVEAVDMVTK